MVNYIHIYNTVRDATRVILMPFNDHKPSKSADTSEHDLVAMESRECPFCGGCGMAPVYAPQHDGTGLYRRGDETPFPTVVGAHCCCSLGRWMRDRNKHEIRQTGALSPGCPGR